MVTCEVSPWSPGIRLNVRRTVETPQNVTFAEITRGGRQIPVVHCTPSVEARDHYL